METADFYFYAVCCVGREDVSLLHLYLSNYDIRFQVIVR